jgi:hypothetical protein
MPNRFFSVILNAGSSVGSFAMNTPRIRPLIREHKPKVKIGTKPPKRPDGSYAGGLHSEKHLLLVARIITYLPQLEERMIDIMSLLLGDRTAPGQQIFRSLVSEEARLKVMRSLLEHARLNRDKTQEFDDIIDLFSEVRTRRNAYAHGLWSTGEDNRAWIQEPSPDWLAEFLSEREVKISELEAVLKRMNELWKKCLAVTYPHAFGADKTHSPSPGTPPPPPHEAR